MKKSRRRYVYGVLCFIVLFLFTACTSTLQKEKEDNTHYEDYSITDSTIIESQDDNTDADVTNVEDSTKTSDINKVDNKKELIEDVQEEDLEEIAKNDDVPIEDILSENIKNENILKEEQPVENVPMEIEPVIYEMEVHFIDVGQADAALVICGEDTMLIDGGNVADSDLIYSYLKKLKVSHLDYIIATHAHEDHVGGLSGALNYADVDTVYCPVTQYDSKAFSNFIKNVEKHNAVIEVPEIGSSFELGNAKVEILCINAGSEVNDTSIVLKITHGEVSFLFTGDAEREAEQAMLNDGCELLSTVLKVGHHGSADSSTYPFLREIMPEYAVISVGKDNSYGHPTESALSRLKDADVKVFRTDLQGDIIARSDTKEVTFEVEKNPNADTYAPPKTQTTPKPSETIPEQEPQQTPEITPEPTPETTPEEPPIQEGKEYVLNTNTKKYHKPSCSSVKTIKPENYEEYVGTTTEIEAMGYVGCKRCKP